MPSLRIQNFGGIAPRISERLLPGNSATTAQNCKLWSGEIRALRDSLLTEAVLRKGFIETIYNLNGYWLSWNGDIDAQRSFIPGDTEGRIYYTGDGPPRTMTLAQATAQTPYPSQGYALGVAAPANVPTVVVGDGGTGVARNEFYVYTFVTNFDEEGAPSDPSAIISALDGQAVTLSNFAAPTTPNVNRIRIYRSQTGTSTTEILFVDEIPYNQTSYTDTFIDSDLLERLTSQQYYPPPNNLTGIVSHPGGFLVGFVGNQLYVSETYQLHAYPPEYVIPFDYPIIALGIYGSTIVVATTGFTYLVSGSQPKSLTKETLPDPYPCVSKRSMASGDRGVVYASSVGLIQVGYAGLQVITRDVLSRDEWQKFNPATIHGAIHDGRYIGFYLTDQGQDYTLVDPIGAGFIFDYNDRATGVEQRDKLTTLDFYTTAMHASPDTDFFFVRRKNRSNELLEWEAGTTDLRYRWKSKAFSMPYITSFGAAKVVAAYPKKPLLKPVTFSLYVDDTLKFTREVNSKEPFRLPSFSRDIEKWYMQIDGGADVQEVHMATSIDDLTEGKAQ